MSATPGPWVAHGGDIYQESNPNGCIRVGVVRKTDAKLVAAAPDLLMALLQVQTDMLRTDFASESDRREYVGSYVRRAIAKAGEL